MKPKWIGYLSVLAIITLIASCGIKTQHYLDRTAAEMTAGLQVVKDGVEQNKWEESRKEYTAFSESWNHTRENWVLFINHTQINNIEMRLARIGEMLEGQEQSSVTAELSEAIMLLQQIPESERLTWRNIL